MHISEGVLSAPVLITGGVVAATGIAIGLRKIDYDHIMTTALLTATFFVASLIHVPVVVGNVHLILGGLMGILLGWSCFPAIFIALLLQSLFFNFGGIVVLGVNTVNMALPPLICYYLFLNWITKKGKKRSIAAFAAGFFSILLSALMMALSLATTDSRFATLAKMLVLAYLPVMIIEGFITMFTVNFLAKVQPELLEIGSYEQ